VYTQFKLALFVKPSVLNLEYHNLYASTDFKHVDEALTSLGIMDVATMREPFYSDLVRQFFCTAFFHDDVDRTVTWMSGSQKCSGTYDDFCSALGYSVAHGKHATGFQIHSEMAMHHSKLAFYVPPNPRHALPNLSSFYYTYHTLASIYNQCLVSKARDHMVVRMCMVNLMWYSHPDRQRHIDVCDYIFQEIWRSVL
jgi:hypothetical protein